MIKIETVEGSDNGRVMLYAISTCIWCRRTKEFLNQLGVRYDYVFVDLLTGDERKQIEKEVEKWNPRVSFPTVVIKDSKCVVGFKEDEIKEALGL